MAPTAIDWGTLTHGTRALAIGYAVVALPMLVGLAQHRAALSRLLRWPFMALIVTVWTTVASAALLWSWGMLGVGLPENAIAPFALLLSASVGYAARLFLAGARPDAVVKRGARVQDGAAWQAMTRRWKQQHRDGIPLAGIRLSSDDEKKHIRILGTTGTGKNTAIRDPNHRARARRSGGDSGPRRRLLASFL